MSEEKKTPQRALDQVVIAVLANRLDSIVREMTNTLFRTGRSAILNTAKDFSCSIVTADNQLLSSADGLPIHVLGGGRQTESMQEFHPDFAAGDAYLHNDPYLGNTHTADHTILVPVFVDGRHLFTVAAKAHQADCGNSDPSTYMPFAKDVYQEGGLNFPCVRIQRNYEDVGDIIRMCRRRIRVPEVWYGDYLAALGAARIGERRLKALVERYGAETIGTFVREWLDYSERRMTHAIRGLPAGKLVAEGRHDSLPGLPDGVPVKVKVEVDPGEGIVTVDLRDNIDCVAVGVNLSQTCATAGALIGVLNCIDPSVPRNEGSFRRIRILLKENCVVGIPRFPASTSMATSNVTNRLINATQRAFSMLGDGYGLAEGAASMGAGFGVVSGLDRRHGNEPYVNQLVIGNNGGPGAPGCDGWVTYCMPDAAASVMVDSAEIIEQKYPLMIRSLRLVEDTGGAGRFRGGPAGEIVYGPLHDPMTVAYFAEMHEDPPKGTRGGGEGSRSRVSRISRDGSEEPLPPIGLVELQPGEFIRGLEAGGGGYGDPMERDPNRVRHDVLEGWITLPAARDTYGVVLKGSSEDGSLAVDGSATTSLRQELAGRRP
ncbi:MAG TPA: hydantoinase B/oxoprolinase family protein [Steroidobacteraceae bacterium]|nr:hydantoinase B/oxoprolinase family protein [Steroidobacteraceae bacterium]